MEMKKTLGISCLYAALIFLIFGSVMYVVRTGRMQHFPDREALNRFDFSAKCGTIEEHLGDKYVDRLLTPADIGQYSPDETEKDFEHYVTYRFSVPVFDGVNYAISCRKSDYALRIYVDGQLLVETGKVAETKEEFEPTAAAYEAFFTGSGKTAEIVIQQANYNHHKHYPVWFRFGPAEQIVRFNRNFLLQKIIIAVILITAALVNLGLFLCFPSRKEILWFSFVCLTASVGTIFPDITGSLAPGVNWYVSHKLEICSVIAIFFFSALYVGKLFRQYVSRICLRIALAVSGAIFLLFAVTPSAIYSRCNEVCLIISAVMTVPMLVSMLIKMIKWRKTMPTSNRLALFGVVCYALVALNDAWGYGGYFQNLDMIGMTAGVAIFAFFNSLALALDFRSSQELLEQAEAREKELDRTNRALTKLDRIRETFLSDLSHELKTPLTVIASNAAVAAKQVTMGKADDMTASRLGNIEREAVRLGKMVEKLKNSAKGQYSEKAENLNVSTVLYSAADFCMPLCARNNNRIVVSCADDKRAYSSANTLFHCLYNLISNATKHSRNSTIELICSDTDGGVIVSVRDHGEGMTDEQMQHAFERGFSGDASTGIGLPLCRELVENEGGTMYLSHTPGGGLTASFVLKEATDNHGENSDDRGQ